MLPLRWLKGSMKVTVILSDETSSFLAFASAAGRSISGVGNYTEKRYTYVECNRKFCI